MESRVTTKNEIKVIGIEVRTSNRTEANPRTAKIPGLWGRFFAEAAEEKIPNRKNPGSLLGVYTNYESDHTGEYSLVISAEVTDLDNIPEGMVGLTIPAAKYLVCPARGQRPAAVIEAWNNIWEYFSSNSDCKRAYTADFELYENSGNAEGPRVDIYIAVS